MLFLVGRNGDDLLDSKLEKESQQSHDILRADFIDAYYNLTLKSMFTLKFYLGFWQVLTEYNFFMTNTIISSWPC